MEDRRIFLTPRMMEWISTKLPALDANWAVEIAPDQQLDDLVATFCAGDVLIVGDHFKKLRYVDDGIWTLKTPDLRIFGWFFLRDVYVASNAGQASFIKHHELYEGLRQEAIRTRDLLNLDEPKFIAGNDPNAVVSNFAFS